MGVGAVLRHDEVRPERGRQLRDEPADRPQPRVGAGERLERHVDDGAGRGPLPDLVGIARAREQVAAGLVERHGQHARIVGMDRLDAVAVVDIEVEVQDAQAVAPGPGDREGRVVVDAEPGCPIGHRVVEAAARVEGVVDVAPQDRLDRPQATRPPPPRRRRASRRRPDRRRPWPIPAAPGPNGSRENRLTVSM